MSYTPMGTTALSQFLRPSRAWMASAWQSALARRRTRASSSGATPSSCARRCGRTGTRDVSPTRRTSPRIPTSARTSTRTQHLLRPSSRTVRTWKMTQHLLLTHTRTICTTSTTPCPLPTLVSAKTSLRCAPQLPPPSRVARASGALQGTLLYTRCALPSVWQMMHRRLKPLFSSLTLVLQMPLAMQKLSGYTAIASAFTVVLFTTGQLGSTPERWRLRRSSLQTAGLTHCFAPEQMLTRPVRR